MFLTPSTTLNIFDDYLIHKKKSKGEKNIKEKGKEKYLKKRWRKYLFIYFCFLYRNIRKVCTKYIF